MAGEYRVICPDVVGRGRSEVLADKNAYGFPQYIADMVTLLARLDVTEVHWVGTSMGGLIGMFLASMAKTPITRLVLNDVGPLVTAESLRRIAEYVGKPVAFSSYREGEAYLRLIGAPFGEMDDAQWDNLCRYALQEGEDGLWRPAYDPGLAEPFRKTFVFQNVDLWPVYEGIACPTLVIRGAESDLLLRDTWQRMGERGPKAQLAEVPGVGHAPMFQTAGQIALVREFLLQP
jgi:pimeloyl-ACP methyl ester carboxylesterase